MTRYDNSKIYAYNIMLGASKQQANAACASGFTPSLPVPTCPATIPGFTAPTCGPNGWTPPPANTIGTRYTGVKPPMLDPVDAYDQLSRTASSARRRASSATTRRS